MSQNLLFTALSCTSHQTLFQKPLNFIGKVDTNFTIASDSSFVIFAHHNRYKKKRANADLFIAYRQTDSIWSIPQKLSISSEEADDTSPNISPDGKRLYFSSNRTGSYGGYDIWVARIDSNGNTYSVRNLGSKINTRQDEKFPFVSPQGKLYFSSNNRSSLGKLDIFEATRRNGKIKIKNLGETYNSDANEFGITYLTDTSGYYYTDRKGKIEIRSFVNKRPLFRYFLAIDVATKDSTNQKDMPLAGSKVEVYESSTSNRKLIYSFITNDKDQSSKFLVEPHKEYVIKVKNRTGKTKYLTLEEEYSIFGHEADPDDPKYNKTMNDINLETTVYLKPLVFNKVIFEALIFFDYHKWDIRPDAAKELNKRVLTFLKNNPKVIIELGVHTDARGKDRYNSIFTQRRAKSAVEYLITKGIKSDRIKAKGYGETDLKIKNAKTEEEHQANRRTTIKIIGLIED